MFSAKPQPVCQSSNEAAAEATTRRRPGAIGTTDRLLSTDQAVAYLAARGVQTSRRLLDQMRAEGALPWVKARGRIRILYRPAALLAAVLQEESACSEPTEERPAGISTSAAPSRDSTFTKALAQATQGAQRRSGSGARKSSSTVTHMEKRRR
tara:strand:- start:4658 stop:5116 length:459 start_codon:yes stop_codon:yes gene_type:complete